MSIQLPLPAHWARELESRRDPNDRLSALRRALEDLKVAIRATLDEFADCQGIPKKDVTYAMDGYVDDMLSDLIFHVERDLEREIEGDQERLGG